SYDTLENAMWRICNYVLILLATAGCLLAQTAPQQVEPKKPLLDFTFPRPGLSWRPGPVPKNKLAPSVLNPRRTAPRGVSRIYLLHRSEETCSIQLLEAPIPTE